MKNPAHLKFIRSLPCSVCLAMPPSHAHHSTADRHSMGKKASDLDTFPLCGQCHQDFHDAKGRFRDWDKARRKLWQQGMVALYKPFKLDEKEF